MSPFWIELILVVLYVLLGPVTWLVCAGPVLKARQRIRLLARPHPPLPEPPPTVTVLVPAKDEAPRVRRCVASVLAQDYPDFELVVIDDRSGDGTGAILDEIARLEPRVRSVHVRPGELPAGWGGKNYALHRGVAGRARGAWMLFVDADVELAPDALRAALAVALRRGYDLVSLLPRFALRGFWEALLQPLAGATTGAMFAISRTNANRHRTAFANGQFMLVRREAYERVGGHEAVRGALSEDTALARRLKDAGYRPRLAWGEGLATVRMYDSLGAIVRGWARNFSTGCRERPWRLLAAVAFVLFCCLSSYAALACGLYREAGPLGAPGGWVWLVGGAVHWLVMTTSLALVYRWAGGKPAYALLFPLGAVFMLAIFARALTNCATGRVEWRGTSYTRAALRAT